MGSSLTDLVCEGTNVDALIECEEVCDNDLISLFVFVLPGAKLVFPIGLE